MQSVPLTPHGVPQDPLRHREYLLAAPNAWSTLLSTLVPLGALPGSSCLPQWTPQSQACAVACTEGLRCALGIGLQILTLGGSVSDSEPLHLIMGKPSPTHLGVLS
jgi:hypothetical protein